jgi:FkbM family methyltransferase
LYYARAGLKPDAICFDVGANIGVTTLLLCKLCPRGHIYSFEPSPVNLRYLKQNLELNGITNCTVVESGVGEQAGTIPFHVSESGAGSHFVTDAHMNYHRTQTINVPVLSLDEFVNSITGFDRLDFIKLDIEGFEPPALAGAREIIRRFNPSIFIEFNFWCLYFAHRFDPFTFASAIWKTFDVSSVDPNGNLHSTANGDVVGFIYANVLEHRCADDVLLRLKTGQTVPSLAEMVFPGGTGVPVKKKNLAQRFFKKVSRHLRSYRFSALSA